MAALKRKLEERE